MTVTVTATYHAKPVMSHACPWIGCRASFSLAKLSMLGWKVAHR